MKKNLEEINNYEGKMLLMNEDENITGLIIGIINNEEITCRKKELEKHKNFFAKSVTFLQKRATIRRTVTNKAIANIRYLKNGDKASIKLTVRLLSL